MKKKETLLHLLLKKTNISVHYNEKNNMLSNLKNNLSFKQFHKKQKNIKSTQKYQGSWMMSKKRFSAPKISCPKFQTSKTKLWKNWRTLKEVATDMHKSHKTHNSEVASTLHLNKMGIILEHYGFRLDQTNNTKNTITPQLLRHTCSVAGSKIN
mgnify:CR=1 FL=1